MKRIWLWIVLILVILGVLAVAFTQVLLPYMQARSIVSPNGVLTIREQADGNLAVSWQEVHDADFYCVELFEPVKNKDDEPVMLYQKQIYNGTACVIAPQDPDRKLTLRVTPGKEYEMMGEIHQRYSQSWLEVTTTFDAPTLSNLQYTPNTDTDSLEISFDLKDGDTCIVTRQELSGTSEVQQLNQGKTQIRFGEGKDLPMPEWNQTETFFFTVQRQGTGYIFYGQEAGSISVVGEDFLDRELNLQLEDLGQNLCRLTWSETKGEFYEVQFRQEKEEEWTTLDVVTRAEERSYASEKLAPFKHYEFRVAAVGGQTMKDSQFAAISDIKEIDSGATPLYCTIWPTKDLKVYTDAQKSAELTKVETGKAYCVIGEETGFFAVLTDAGVGYIDNRYCMINLPEFLGDLCAYNITNSYDSLYMVHEYEMPGITGTTITGYKDIRLDDNSYLVPLLYPTALMLEKAALSARDYGYRLKIYDAYRPNKATVGLYNEMEDMLDGPIPEKTYTGKKVTLEMPEPEEPVVETGPDGETLPTQPPEDPILTYRFVMTNNEWPTHNFLAKGTSKHNLGVALDLTLEEIETGKELKMQTSMHDLSWYSSRGRNDSDAKVLTKIMTGAGFGTIKSEWWHYQDNDSRSNLNLATVKNGVNCECWMQDVHGWRYREKSGEYLTDCKETIDGVEYVFDAYGYIQGAPVTQTQQPE